MGLKIAVIGATGLVGRKIITLLEKRNFPVGELLPIASEKSVGKTIYFREKKYKIIPLEKAIEETPDIAIYSAGSSISLQTAKAFAQKGTFVIDNSSAWRMEKGIPLIIPEINSEILTQNDKIIANPNCSTIQLLMAIAPIHKAFGIKRCVISTYQSITGTGKKAIEQMRSEREGTSSEKIYPYPIDKNCLPQCDVFLENGYTKEEMKLVLESQKILQAPEMKITATAVRVPIMGGHCESVNIELEKAFTIKGIRQLLEATQGVILQDEPENLLYPMPLSAEGKDEVFVGRIRKDTSCENGLNLWIVADNLHKGAATNAVQIAEYLVKQGWV